MIQRRIRAVLGPVAVAVVAAIAFAPVPALAAVTSHTGSGRPALATSGGRLYVGWAGSTGSPNTKELVFGWSLNRGLNITKVGNGERVPQGTGPALDGDGQGGVYLAWPAGNAGNTLTVAYYNGTALTCRTPFTGISTAFSPALANDGAGHRYLAWTDSAGRLNLGLLDAGTCASTGTMRLLNRVTLHDISFAGPALGWDENVSSSNLGFMLGWVDRGGDLRIASYDGTPVLKNRSVVASPVKVAGAASLSSEGSDDYVSWRGVDGNVYFGYSEGCTVSCFQTSGTIADHGTGGVGLVSDGPIIQAYFDAAGRLNIT